MHSTDHGGDRNGESQQISIARGKKWPEDDGDSREDSNKVRDSSDVVPESW